jgi:hypothetical protein
VVLIKGLQQRYLSEVLYRGMEITEGDIVMKSTAKVWHRYRSFLHFSDVETGGEDLLR